MNGVLAITKIRNERPLSLSDASPDRLLEACKASTNAALYTVVMFALSTDLARMKSSHSHWPILI